MTDTPSQHAAAADLLPLTADMAMSLLTKRWIGAEAPLLRTAGVASAPLARVALFGPDVPSGGDAVYPGLASHLKHVQA